MCQRTKQARKAYANFLMASFYLWAGTGAKSVESAPGAARKAANRIGRKSGGGQSPSYKSSFLLEYRLLPTTAPPTPEVQLKN